MSSNFDRAFDPWIGRRYQLEGLDGLKLLALGESQYGPPGHLTEPIPGIRTRDSSSTQEIVQDLGIECRNAFFTKIYKLVSGRLRDPPSPEDKASFWQQVAFYNYIQWWLPRARFRPSPEMWQAAREPFLRVLEEYEPDVVLVLGKGTASWLPPIPDSIVTIRIAHPSSAGFSYEPWASRIRDALRARSPDPHQGTPPA
jgi:hypothetical protein